MTAPVWMAAPPEVHSTLLSSGPGPASLQAAAGAWSLLSSEYAAVADELSALVGQVQPGAWQGPSAESYAAANVPYVAWLLQASANSAEAAAQHENAAAGYTSALATMPTLAELAANHAIHAVLVATNFFGINTIPIALNEADYARMWVQAATTMTTYQAVSAAAVAATPSTTTATPILKADSAAADDSGTQDIIDNDGGDPNDPSWYVNRVTEITETLGRDFSEFFQNPSAAISQLESDIPALISDEVGHLGEFITTFQPELITAALALPIPAVGAVGGLAGLAGLTGLAAPVAPTVPDIVPTPAPTDHLPAAGLSPTTAPATAPATSPTPNSAPVTSSVPSYSPPPPAPATAVAGTGFVPPYVVGPPGIGAGFGAGAKTQEPTSRGAAKAPEGAAAAAAAVDKAAARRRPRVKQRGHGDEFMDMNVEVDPEWGDPSARDPVASDRGAGTVGFAGTVGKHSGAPAAGLATLVRDEFSAGPTTPMVPGTWDSDDQQSSGKET